MKRLAMVLLLAASAFAQQQNFNGSGGGSATPGGASGSIQYNNASALGGFGSYNATTGTFNVPGLLESNQRPIAAWPGQGVTCFGDSITQGSIAPQTSQGYCPLIQQMVGGTFNNYGVSGDQVADMARRVLTNSTPPYFNGPITTELIGTNDVTIYGANAGQQTIYTNALGASIAWPAVPTTSKVYAQNAACVQGGSWSVDNTFQTGLGEQSTTNASTLSCTIVTKLASAPIYVWFRTYDAKAGTFTVQVDGGATTTLYGSGCGTNVSCSSSVISTTNGAVDTVVLYRTAAVAAGSHVVLFTVTSATNAANIVDIQAVGAPAPIQGVGFPLVAVGGVPKQMSDANSALTAAYDTLANNESLLLNGDGLQVYAVPVRSPVTAWGPGGSFTGNILNSTGPYTGALDTACAGSDMYNALHPNVCGHEHLRDAFLWIINPYGVVDSAPENVQASTNVLIDLSANTGTNTTMATKHIATRFTVGSSAITAGGFQCRMDRTGAITNGSTAFVQASYYNDSAGVVGTVLATNGASYFMTDLPAAYVYVLFFPVSQALAANTSYWLDIQYSAAPTGSNIQFDSATSTNNGATSPDGTTWTPTNIGLNCQMVSLGTLAVQGTSVNNIGVTGTSTGGVGVSGTSRTWYGGQFTSTNNFGLDVGSTYATALNVHSTNGKAIIGTGAGSSVAILGTCTTCGGAIQGQATGAAGVGVFAQSTSTGDGLQANSTSGNDANLVNGKLKLGSPCANSGGTCGAATSGSVSIAAAATTVTVATTAVAATDRIFVFENMTKGAALSVTCNTTQGRTYAVTTVTAATSFVITTSAAPATNPACLDYVIIH